MALNDARLEEIKGIILLTVHIVIHSTSVFEITFLNTFPFRPLVLAEIGTSLSRLPGRIVDSITEEPTTNI